MGTIKPEVDPADVGFDAARLEVLDKHLERYVDDGLLPGWLIAVSRHGQLAQPGRLRVGHARGSHRPGRDL